MEVNCLLKVALIGLILIKMTASVPSSEFFPFGLDSGDQEMDSKKSQKFTLKTVFPIFNKMYKNLFINRNGAVSFGEEINGFKSMCGVADNKTMILPYWAKVKTTERIYFRETTNQTLLAKIGGDIEKFFPALGVINFNWMLIVTWSNVSFERTRVSCTGNRNTFQLILTTNTTHSFALFYYDTLKWTAGSDKISHGNCAGLGGLPAKAGFEVGDGAFFGLPGSCTDDILELANKSNVGEAGKWIFRVDVGSLDFVRDTQDYIEIFNGTVNINECGSIRISMGTFRYSDDGHSVSFKCFKNYKLIGSENVACLAGFGDKKPRWSDRFPHCEFDNGGNVNCTSILFVFISIVVNLAMIKFY